jgi:hypothetical protein
MIGRLLCWRGWHDWSHPRIAHRLAFPATVAVTVPVATWSCQRKRCAAWHEVRL